MKAAVYLVALVLLLPAGATASPVGAKSADAFVDSVGVNVHLGYSDTVYGRFDKIESALERLGVHHIRDGISPGRPDVYARMRHLAAEGIRLDAIAGDPRGSSGERNLGHQLQLLAARLGPGVLASIESANEFDNNGFANWAPILRRFQRRLWRGVQARPRLAPIPVLGPSLVRAESRAELGDISRWTTEGNMHPYPGGNPPDEDEHMESELELAAENTGAEPVQATETGYTNAVHAGSGQLPASERAAGIYMPRVFLDAFRRGITRTYAYQLIDTSPDPARRDTEANFGLLHNDFSPKPAFTEVANLISLLEDPGPKFAPASLSYDVSGDDQDLRQLLLQKRDGSFYLALWNASSVWDPQSRTALDPGTNSINVRFGVPVSQAEVFRPGTSPTPVATAANPAAIDLQIGPEVTVLELTPGSLKPLGAIVSGTLPAL